MDSGADSSLEKEVLAELEKKGDESEKPAEAEAEEEPDQPAEAEEPVIEPKPKRPKTARPKRAPATPATAPATPATAPAGTPATAPSGTPAPALTPAPAPKPKAAPKLSRKKQIESLNLEDTQVVEVVEEAKADEAVAADGTAGLSLGIFKNKMILSRRNITK